MTGRRTLLVVVLILVFGLVQICAINEIPLPLGLPDLPVLAVVAIALAWGPIWGSCAGFATGLMIDIAPPADHAVGRLAFAYALIGYLVGQFEEREEHSVPATILTVVGAAAGLVIVDVVMGEVLGDGSITMVGAGKLLVAAVGYDVILAPFVVPLLIRLARRAEPARA